MIKRVIRTDNDTVMVFDENGEQMPRYQGNYCRVKELVLADAPADAIFNHWFGDSREPEVVAAESW
ncbi:MAG: hypothetical protein A2Z15_05485 [Chloroflexi bacterium RBG_16_50_11]|nr:MAG: hypothetical protein A2Z15_05485 [Chloroflexi bacterium RBG_16_50_11]